jgi:predicted cobalt transporter CbtA
MLLKNKWRWLGLPLLALPFLIGAPQAEGPSFAHYAADAAAQMEMLKSRFVVATAIASAGQWIVLGLLSGVAVSRWIRPLLVPAFERPTVATVE